MVKDFMQTLLSEFRHVAATETIIGEAKVFGDVTLIPVIRIGIGVGAGGGEGESPKPKEAGTGRGNGLGGGGGVRVEPAAFIVLRGGDVQIMAAPGRGGRMAEAFEHLPDLVTKVMAARQTTEAKD